MWYERELPGVVFIDLRASVKPHVVADSCRLPFRDSTFDLVVFDPPHLNCGPNSIFAMKYSHATTQEIRRLISGSARELRRVSKRSAYMAFKWSDHDTRLSHAIGLLDGWRPLFGTRARRAGKERSVTTWTFLRCL